MKQIAKKWLSLFLALAMIIGIMPMTAFAAPEDEISPLAVGDGTGLPIHFYLARPGTEPTPTSNSYEDYPNYDMGSVKAMPAAFAEVDVDGIRNVTDESIIKKYIDESTLPGGETLEQFEDFGSVSFWGQSYSSEDYDVVWVSISLKYGYGYTNNGNDPANCNCRDMTGTPHIHIDGILSERVRIPEDLSLYKVISEAQPNDGEAEAFTFTLEKLVQDEDFAPTDEADDSFTPIELNAEIEDGQTRGKITGSESVVGTFGYYRVTENSNPKWEPTNAVYIEIATNGSVKYSYDLDPDNFRTMSNATITNQYQTYTVRYEDGLNDVAAFNAQAYVDLRYGVSTPSFEGGTPMYPGGHKVFTGWSPAVADTVTEDVTYVAQWSDVTYTVTWQDSNGNVLETDTGLVFGDMPKYNNGGGTTEALADKKDNAQYKYSFAGWSPAVTTVTGNQTYTATYSTELKTYTVTWYAEDGKTILEKDENVPYHSWPQYDGEEPSKEGNDQHTYTFIGWTPTRQIVEGDQKYVATFRENPVYYTITWMNYNGVYETNNYVSYGDDPEDYEPKTTPTRTADNHFTYTFSHWAPVEGGAEQYTPVDGNETYYAVYTAKPRLYTGTVELVLNATYNPAEGKPSGDDDGHYTTVPAATVLGSSAQLYLKDDEGGTKEYPLTESTVTRDNKAYIIYTNDELPYGDYRVYMKGQDAPICDQLLIINEGDRTRYLYYYSVEYDANGGDGAPATGYVHADKAAVISEQAPARNGYRFLGWTLDQAGTGTGTVYQPGAVLDADTDRAYTLYAQWEKLVNVKVIVNIDHGTASGYDPNAVTMHDATFSLMVYNGTINVPTGETVTLTPSSHSGYSYSYKAEEYSTTYQPSDVTFPDMPAGDYTVSAYKSGYDTTVTKTTEGDTQVITVKMVYNPDDFDLQFQVVMDAGVPEALYPRAVNVKVSYWGYNGGELGWHIITQQAGTAAPEYVVIDPETGTGTGSYPVWKHWSGTDNAYEYRIEIVSFIAPNGDVVPADETTAGVTYTSKNGICVGEISVEDGGRVPKYPDVSNTTLSGAFYDGNAQVGIPTATITIHYGSITIDPNGGNLNGSEDDVVLKELVRVPDISGYVPTHDEAGYVFTGYTWYLADSEETPVTALATGAPINKDYILVANWLEPITVMGTVTVDVTAAPDAEKYYLEKVDVLLQNLATGETLDDETLPDGAAILTYNNKTATVDYAFTGLPANVQYRVYVLVHNYTETYDNEAEAPDGFDPSNYTAVDENGDGKAVVDIYLAYNTDPFTLKYEVDVSAIGEDSFIPETAKTRPWYYKGEHYTDPKQWEAALQKVDNWAPLTDTGVSISLSETVTSGSYQVPKYRPNGRAYNYAVYLNEFSLPEGAVAAGGDTTPYNVSYEAPAYYVESTGEQDDMLRIILTPKSYPITYYLEKDSTVRLTGLTPTTHTWSVVTELKNEDGTWKSVPTRSGYLFAGWVDAAGKPVTEIAANVAAETKLYATWEVDNWKDDPNGDSPTGGDGIPDSQQVHILYTSDANGSVRPIGEIVTIKGAVFENVTVTGDGTIATPVVGYAFDQWNYIENADDEDDALTGWQSGENGKQKPTLKNVDGGKTYTIQATFGTDTQGNEEDGGSDGIPDKYQVFVEFVSADSQHGTVANEPVRKTFTSRTGFPETIQIKLGTGEGEIDVQTVPAGNYTFDYWTLDTGSDAILFPYDLSVEAGKTYVFHAHFAIDEWSDGDQKIPTVPDSDKEGDGIPDYKQALVKFVAAANGRGEVTGSGTVQVFTFTAEAGYRGTATPLKNVGNHALVIVTPYDGFAFDYWGDTDNFFQKGYGAAVAEKNVFGPHDLTGGQIVVYTAHFSEDKWNDETDEKEKPDGIPDNRQVLIEYVSDNEEQGSVAPSVEVITLTNKGSQDIEAAGAGAQPAAGYAFDRWYYNQRGVIEYDYKSATIAPKITGAMGGDVYTFIATFAADEKFDADTTPDVPDDEDDGDKSDGIPDKYQIEVIYEAGEGGSVTPAYEVITLKDADGTPVEYGEAKAGGSLATADEDYAFDRWSNDYPNASFTHITPATGEITLQVADGTPRIYTFTASFGEDVEGGEPQGGNDVPDVYEKKVTFLVENGAWSDGTDKPIVVYVPLRNADGEYDPNGTGTLTIPTGMKADSGYTGGQWKGEAPVTTVSGTDPVTYTYTFNRVITPVPTNGSVLLTKVDASDSSTTLAKVIFELYKADGTLVGTYTTNDDGQISVSGLMKGDYYWVETRPAEGYVLDSTEKHFTVAAAKTTEMTVENTRSAVPSVFSGDHYAYVIGYDDGMVHPEANITRAEVATIFFRLLDETTRSSYMTRTNPFSDVEEGMWFNTAVSTMAAMGIVNGHPDGTFAPEDSITRAEFAAIAARFEIHGNTTGSSFDDIYGHWAQKEINVAYNNGWILGYVDGTFRPDQFITRAEAMAMVNRVLQRIPQYEDDLLPDMVQWPDNQDTAEWYYLTVQEATNSHDYSRKDSGYEYWLELRPVPDWTALEQ